MKLLLKIMYDGTAYHGFQYQTNALTVQEVLTRSVSDSLGIECTVTGCSRTDAGVHALGYCAAVEPSDESKRGDAWCGIPTEKIHRVLNMGLPRDISVVGACTVSDEFHPRYDAVSKEYIYKICDSVAPDPFLVNRAYHIKRKLSDGQISVMNEAGAHLLGRHDFSGFMAQGSSVKDTVRDLKKLCVCRTGESELVITAAADGFLYNMVRILAGTLLDAAYGKINPSDIPDILESLDRARAGYTAPAHALYLNRVDYGQRIDFKAE